MKVADPGHAYLLTNLDADSPLIKEYQTIYFVKREGEKYPGNIGHHPGTTTQEVLRALIERTIYVNNQIPDGRNGIVLQALRGAIYQLEARAAERHGRMEEFADLLNGKISSIETFPTCKKCGHIGCSGTCHD